MTAYLPQLSVTFLSECLSCDLLFYWATQRILVYELVIVFTLFWNVEVNSCLDFAFAALLLDCFPELK